MALVLPPPTNSALVGSDAVNSLAQNDSDSGTPAPSAAPKASKYIEGLIYPPPDIRTIIDRTASFVARSANPPQFEEKIREKHRQDPKFTFVNPTDSYHAYYKQRIEKIQAGEDDSAAQDASKADETMDLHDVPMNGLKDGIPKEPPAQEFVLEKPSLTALDLDVLKLTALFAARQGQSWLNSLTAREGRNFQFEFLRPNHSLFGYFNRMVDQYTKILIPPPETLEYLAEIKAPGGKWKTLENVRERAEWEGYRREREKRRNDDKEDERKAFAEIDWHDYAIVQTIDFTAADFSSELPPPMSIAEVENMTLAQKKMAAMIMENTAPEVEAIRAAQADLDRKAAEGGDMEMEVENDAGGEAQTRREEDSRKEMEETERAKAMQSLNAAPMKIRKDYVPKTLAGKNSKAATTTCTICGQTVAIAELDEHMRIELLDPRWKTQRDALEARRATANEQQLGANVVNSLKQLARVFGDDQSDEANRKRLEAEGELRRKEREKVAWDGFTASKEGTVNKFQNNVNFDEQIASIWKAKGLGGTDPAASGPGIGPSIGPAAGMASSAPPPLPASLPPNPLINPATGQAYTSATVASGPQPATQYGGGGYLPPPQNFPLPPNPGFGPPPGFGGGPMLGMHPSRLAQLGGEGMPPGVAGVTRSADEMMGADGMAPPAKRQKIAKLPEGQYYTETDWATFHPEPITLSIRLPSQETSEVPLKPEWNMDGSVIELTELPVTLLTSSLRDRILSHIKSTLAGSRVKLSYGTKVLPNSSSLATYNLDDGDEIVLTVREAKKK